MEEFAPYPHPVQEFMLFLIDIQTYFTHSILILQYLLVTIVIVLGNKPIYRIGFVKFLQYQSQKVPKMNIAISNYQY